MGGVTLVLSLGPASSQPIDCGDLAARITALGAGSQTYTSNYGGAAQKQRAELDRTIRSARALRLRPEPILFIRRAAAAMPGP